MVPGSGFFDLTAGVVAPFGGPIDVSARAELGVKPSESTSIFGFAEATLKQVQAGLGFRKTF